MAFSHEPVMLAECIEALGIYPDGLYLDGTAGGGGHARAIAKKLHGGTLYAMDQDPDAIAALNERLDGLPAVVIRDNFRAAPCALRERGVTALDGALLDLGVSSHQLDDARRGFSYHGDGSLDMRMSQSGRGAAEIVATADRQALADILRRYGEESYAWQIAGKIVAERERQAIETTGRLAEVVLAGLPPAARRKAKHPARRTFQALRMAVNEELEALSEGLDGIFEMLKAGGRLAVISFHSLEDRLVKQRFRQWGTACTCPPELPVCVCGGVAEAKVLTKSPIVPSPEEQAKNSRSRSAKLRVVEKL